MSIKFVNGNILTFPERDEDTIICHQVNCKGVMGAGLAYLSAALYDSAHCTCCGNHWMLIFCFLWLRF